MTAIEAIIYCLGYVHNIPQDGEYQSQTVYVDPVINRLCILINDSYGHHNEDRTNDIMGFGLFRPLYTKGTQEDTERRFLKYIDTYYRKWVPATMAESYYFPYHYSTEEISILLNSQPVVDIYTYKDLVRLFIKPPFFKSYLDICHTTSVNSITELMGVHSVSLHSMSLHIHAGLVKKEVFGLLDELITMGPHAPDEPSLPVCGIPKFLELVGAK